jgi:hypothetical protein
MERPYGELIKEIYHFEIRYVKSVKRYVLYNPITYEYILWSNVVYILEEEADKIINSGRQQTLF